MLRYVAVILAGAMLLASCSTSSGAERDVIQVQVSGEAEEIAVYDALVNAFEKGNPGIDVQLMPVSDKDDHLAKLTTSFSNGNPPDVFLINFREYSQYVARGAVDAVGPYLDENGVDAADYYHQPMEAFTYDGELQCMPQNISSLVVYYNTKLLKEAGLERPREDWDWDEFRRYAVELTTDEERGLGIEPSVIRLAPFVWSNGGELTDDPDTPCASLSTNRPRARRWSTSFRLSAMTAWYPPRRRSQRRTSRLASSPTSSDCSCLRAARFLRCERYRD
ncbi:hypothetical protein BH20ACT23_BH20ACT23_20300 [soil metagenome]